MKLYFDLGNADLIPACMKQESKTLRNRGHTKDIWDDGPTLAEFSEGNKKPVKLPILLCLIVGLFSTVADS